MTVEDLAETRRLHRVAPAGTSATSGSPSTSRSLASGQTLYVTDGIGYVATRGGDAHEIRALATSSTSSREKSIGTVPLPTGSWRASPSRRRTRPGEW